MPINLRGLYAGVAAVVVVLLGLGLIYLVAMDRITAAFAVVLLLAGGATIPVLAAVREMEREIRTYRPQGRPAVVAKPSGGPHRD